MKTIASALLALAVLAGAAAPAAAYSSDGPFDAKMFFEQLEDQGG